MKKKIFVCLTILLTLFSFSPVTKANQNQPPDNLQEAVNLVNQELGREYFTQTNLTGESINWIKISGLSGVTIGSTSDTFGALVYGDPHSDPSDNPQTKNGQYRYLGYTYNGEHYTNPAFPHDAWAGGYLEDRHWIKTPWDNNVVSGVSQNDFDGNTKYLPNIQRGIATYYTDVSKGGDSDYCNNWYQYVHILVPPTEYTWGMGRMWHQELGGGIWYISVPLAPGAMLQQLVLDVEPKTATINVGEEKQYDSYLVFPDGNKIKVTNKCTWVPKDPSVAEKVFVNGNEVKGLFRGLKNGTVDVIATLDDQTLKSILQNN